MVAAAICCSLLFFLIFLLSLNLAEEANKQASDYCQIESFNGSSGEVQINLASRLH